MPRTPGNRQHSWWRIAIDVIMLLLTVFLLYYAWKAEQRAAAAEVRAEAAEKAKQDLQTKLDKAHNDLRQLAPEYRQKVQEAHIALSKYSEVKNAQNLAELKTRVKGLLVFVNDWRQVSEALAAVLNKELNTLGEAVQKDDVAKLVEAIQIVEQNLPAKLEIWERRLEKFFIDRSQHSEGLQ
jgi:hypothetical protein